MGSTQQTNTDPVNSLPTPPSPLSAFCFGCDVGGGEEMAETHAPPVFENGFQTVTADGGHKVFPSLVLLPSGRLVLGYRKGQAHTLDPGRIVLRTSHDGAATWSPEWTAVSDSVHDVSEPSLRQLSDGGVSMSWFVLRTTDSSPVGVNHATSTNSSETWSAPVLVAAGAATQDGVVELPGDGWVLGNYEPDPNRLRAFRPYVSASTDGGQTWNTRAELTHPDTSLAFSEASIILLSNGRLYYAEAVECGGEVLVAYGMEGDDEAEVRLRGASRGGPTCSEAVSGLATSELAQR